MKPWDARTGELLRTVEGNLGDVWSIAFSPDGKAIVYCGHETVTMVDPETGQKKQTLMIRTLRPH
jgi:WD40 repeat protein